LCCQHLRLLWQRPYEEWRGTIPIAGQEYRGKLVQCVLVSYRVVGWVSAAWVWEGEISTGFSSVCAGLRGVEVKTLVDVGALVSLDVCDKLQHLSEVIWDLKWSPEGVLRHCQVVRVSF
jgi:hypothetical protein